VIVAQRRIRRLQVPSFFWQAALTRRSAAILLTDIVPPPDPDWNAD